MKHSGRFMILVLLLSACRTSLITDLIVPSGQILFKDDFLDPLSGWPRINASTWGEDYANGSYQIKVNIPQFDLWAVPGQVFGDARVEADATRLAGPDSNRFGLICRYRNPKEFYFFIISSDGYYAIGKTLDGTSSMLGQDMMAYNKVIVPGINVNHLRFDCIANILTGYVNGQALASASDDDISKGDAGLIVGTFNTPGVQVAFRNFVVIKP